MNEYPEAVRREARRLWLTGNFSDEEVAARLGIPRADTIRDWRHQEGWTLLAQDIASVLDDAVKAQAHQRMGEFRTRYDQLGLALEGRAVKALSNPNLQPRDLKAIAGTLALTQRIRDKALGEAEAEKGARGIDLAAFAEAIRRHRERREHGNPLGRCRGPDVDSATPPDGAPATEGVSPGEARG